MQPEIYWIPSPWSGRLAVLPRPRGDWLEDEFSEFRRMGVDVMVSDPAVSRLHAEIEPREDGLWVRDLRSRNGTFVEGVFVTP